MIQFIVFRPPTPKYGILYLHNSVNFCVIITSAIQLNFTLNLRLVLIYFYHGYLDTRS